MLSEPRLYEIIGENIRRRREQQPAGKLTQGVLAEAVGLERTSISNIEKGTQKVSVVTLYQIAEALNVTMVDLLPRETIRPSTAPRPGASSLLADMDAQLKRFPKTAQAAFELIGEGV
jgi:transcriptional regulator with XRE-family HTH domain